MPRSKAHNRFAARVSEVAATVNIAEIRFVSFSAKCPPPGVGPLSVEFKYKTTTHVDSISSPQIVVLADFIMEARPSNGDDSKPCCEIVAQLSLTYDCPKATDFSPAHLEAFGQANGVFNAWPYWREFVQSTTTRMGLPPLVAPSLKPGIAESGSARSAGGNK